MPPSQALTTLVLPFAWQAACTQAARAFPTSHERLSLDHVPQINERLGEHGYVRGILPLEWAVKPAGAWYWVCTAKGVFALYVSPEGKPFDEA